ncbi:MAG: UDP-N-acetylmuramate dehydrogenase [Ignavibacteria bacterium]
MKKNILLSDLTTIGLGGKAKYFMSCASVDDILSALNYAKENKIKVQVMSGGSNIIFPDDGYDGLVMKIDIKGVNVSEDLQHVFVNAGAGENWDEFVEQMIQKNLTGVECLSGIPGSVGATPIQNVGAYGQEVKDTIFSVEAIDRVTLRSIIFTNEECDFKYRNSRFKSSDPDKYIITEVMFRFKKDKAAVIKYDQLQNYIETKIIKFEDLQLNEKLTAIRNAVIGLRKSKSMIIDKADPNSRSCGSFFMNPVLSKDEFEAFKKKTGEENNMPVFVTGDGFKIPSAWLVEQAGFRKGYIKGGVGISGNHSLALININGTTDELLSLSDDIEKTIKNKFGLTLKKEPLVV